MIKNKRQGDKMMRDDIENGYNVFNGTRRRNAPSNNGIGYGHSYSSIPAHAQHDYGTEDDIDILKKQSASFRTFSSPLNSLPLEPSAQGVSAFFQSSAHLTEGPNQPYYRDNFNDQPHTCTLGTAEENGIWCNNSDQAGTIMACLVWLLMAYSAFTFAALARTGGTPTFLAAVYVILCVMALACHAKTTFTDPGSVPQAAVPNERMRREMGTPDSPLSMCSQCQTFKPPFSHHCRICNRCVSRMDHHCP